MSVRAIGRGRREVEGQGRQTSRFMIPGRIWQKKGANLNKGEGEDTGVTAGGVYERHTERTRNRQWPILARRGQLLVGDEILSKEGPEDLSLSE